MYKSRLYETKETTNRTLINTLEVWRPRKTRRKDKEELEHESLGTLDPVAIIQQ